MKNLMALMLVAIGSAQTPQPALEGLDPVLLAQGREEAGKATLTAQHGRFLYAFANAETRQQFLADPERWGIQLDGSCARMGAPVRGNADSYAVHEGRIYVFGSTECYRLFRESPSRFLAKPVSWKPERAALARGAARLTEVRAAMGLAGVVGWKETRSVGPSQRTLTARLPFTAEVETTNPRFRTRQTVTREKVEQTFQDRTTALDGPAAKAARAILARDLLWLVSGSLEAVENDAGVDVFTGSEVVHLELKDRRPVAAAWQGRDGDGAIAALRTVYSDFRAVDGATLPFKGEVLVDGKADGGLSWTIGALSLMRPQASWPQWGGPRRDFHIAAAVEPWAASGPRRIWSRKLGDGYSGVVVSEGTLYTMYREGDVEVVLAAETKSGKTVWEHHYDAPKFAGFEDEQGAGPRATPLVDGGLLYTIGATGRLHCLDRATGRPVWILDLNRDLGAKVRARGYAVSPLAFGDTIIVLAGAPGGSVMALRKKDGGVVWKAGAEDVAYASPLLMTVAGRPVLVALLAREVVGLDPATGKRLWSHPHLNSELVNASTPVAGEDGILFLSSAYDGGCRALQVSPDGVKELWSHRLMRLHHSNAVRIGETIFGSSGDMGPTPLTALDVKSGRVLWRDRGLAKANILAVDGGRLLLLDEEGTLVLAEPGAAALRTLARSALVKELAWTAPTLVDGTLYVRTRLEMSAWGLP